MLKRAVSTLVLAAAMATTGGSAAAQSTSSVPYGRPGDRAATFAAIRETARCVAGNKTELADNLLATKAGSTEEFEIYRAMFERRERSCVRYASLLSFHPQLMRGAIAEALYRRRAADAPIIRPIEASAYTSLVRQGVMRAPPSHMAAFADCVTASRPAEVHALLTTTKMDSAEEKTAMRGLVDALSACLPNGQQISLAPLTMRVALAESAYNLDLKARTPSAVAPAAANGTK